MRQRARPAAFFVAGGHTHPRGGEKLVGEEQLIRAMGWMRTISGAVEIAAALFIWRTLRVEDAVRINALLGLVGPAVFVIVTALGLMGMAERLSWTRALLILGGVGLILSAVRQD